MIQVRSCDPGGEATWPLVCFSPAGLQDQTRLSGGLCWSPLTEASLASKPPVSFHKKTEENVFSYDDLLCVNIPKGPLPPLNPTAGLFDGPSSGWPLVFTYFAGLSIR